MNTDTRDKRTPRYCKPTKNNHARLSLAFSRDTDEPRRYAQSTSGLRSSTRTSPPDSRSSPMQVDSAIRSFVERALRKYPMVVPARKAYASWSERLSELRYVRSDSIQRVLPDGSDAAIPFVHSIAASGSYDEKVHARDIRKKRLKQLVDEYGTKQALADRLGVEQNYVSKLLDPRTPFGEKTALRIERGAGKQDGWLSVEAGLDGPRPMEWPFQFDRELWYRLPPEQRQQIEDSIYRQILGAGIIDHAAARASKRRRRA